MASAIVYYVYKWISLGSIEERASATRTPIAEERRGESRYGCDSGRNIFTGGCLRNKNVLKLEAGMLEKIRTF